MYVDFFNCSLPNVQVATKQAKDCVTRYKAPSSCSTPRLFTLNRRFAASCIILKGPFHFLPGTTTEEQVNMDKY